MCLRHSGRNAASASWPYTEPMACEIATELASSAPTAALNSASRPSRAAPVAAAASNTCSASKPFSAARRLAACVADVAGDAMPPAPIDIDFEHPTVSVAASAAAPITPKRFRFIARSPLWLVSLHAELAAHGVVPLAEVGIAARGRELDRGGRV